MSCGIVKDSCINRVLAYIYTNRDDWGLSYIKSLCTSKWNINIDNFNDLKILGIKIKKLNGDAYFEKYRRDPHTNRNINELNFCLIKSNSIQVYKDISCMLYECAEGDIPEISELYKMLEILLMIVAEDIITKLPEYENSKWDVHIFN